MEWDPEGIWIRVQDKGLPVVYHPDFIFKLTVGALSDFMIPSNIS